MKTAPKVCSLVILMAFAGVSFTASPYAYKAYAAPTQNTADAPAAQILSVKSAPEPTLVRDIYDVVAPPPPPTIAEVRQQTIAASPGLIESRLQGGAPATRLHEPQDATVFYPLSSWTFEYNSNGFRTANRPAHDGTDFQAPSGTEIFSIAAGVVTEVGGGGDYGNYVVIAHKIGGRTVTSLYAHQVSAPVVKKGDTVEALQLIGYVGSTGRSTGPHLHLVITVDGVLQDPGSWLIANALR